MVTRERGSVTPNAPWRLTLFVLGWISLVVGLIMLLVPAIPMWPFLVLTAYCFDRSSKRFHDWLLNHRWLGPHVRRWQATGGIALRAKATAILITAAVTGSYDIFVPGWWSVKIPTSLLALSLIVYILYVPTIRPGRDPVRTDELKK